MALAAWHGGVYRFRKPKDTVGGPRYCGELPDGCLGIQPGQGTVSHAGTHCIMQLPLDLSICSCLHAATWTARHAKHRSVAAAQKKTAWTTQFGQGMAATRAVGVT